MGPTGHLGALRDLRDPGPGVRGATRARGVATRQVLDPVTGEVRSEPRRGPARQKGRAPAGGEILVDSVNIAEQRAFQSGRKCVAIITEAPGCAPNRPPDRPPDRGVGYRPPFQHPSMQTWFVGISPRSLGERSLPLFRQP